MFWNKLLDIAELFDDDEASEKETHMRAPCNTKKLNDLEELELTSAHEEIIKKTPFVVFKDLARFNMYLVLLEIVLQHWYQKGNQIVSS